MTDDSPADYQALTPDVILDAVEHCGYRTDGRFLALNSYENRVYQVGIEDQSPLIGKFYRPARWTDESILEEHEFALALAAAEIPVVAPLEVDGDTLLHYQGYRYALYPSQGGHWPELASREQRAWMGRFIGRLHQLGAAQPFRHRPTLDVEDFGERSQQYLLEQGFIPAHLEQAYQTLSDDLLKAIRSSYERADPLTLIRLHGDCHPGNILWSDAGPHFVDLDDCRTGPAIQDLWMLISGERGDMQSQLADLVEGYQQFRDLDLRELALIEPLRTLRIMHYAAWLARRWDDPAFPRAFPWFNTPRYWEDHILSLREQAALLDEAPLAI